MNNNLLFITNICKKKNAFAFFCSSGGRTRTCDLRVMSPTSYQLLYPAIALQKYNKFCKLQKDF